MQKKKVKKFLALLLAVSMIAPAQMTVFAEDGEGADAQQTPTPVVEEVQDAEQTDKDAVEESASEVATEVQKQESQGQQEVQTASDPVAEVSGVGYATFREALAKAKASKATLTLKQDVEVSEVIIVEAGESLTLDLAGKTLTLKPAKEVGSDVISVENGTFKIESSVNGGKLNLMGGTSIGADGESAKVILESGTVESPEQDNANGRYGYGIAAYNDATLVVNGGEVISQNAALTGNNTTGNMNFQVHGGTLTAEQGPAIYMPGQVELTITDGVINGGISLRMGQVKISGGTINAITSGIDSPAEYYNYSGNAWFPDALYVFGGTYTSEDKTYGNSLNVEITGGTFNCTNGQGSAVGIYDLGKVSQSQNVSISGAAKFVTNAKDRKAYQVLSLADIGVTNPKPGYGAITGNVKTNITGGFFSTPVDVNHCGLEYLPAQSNEYADAPYTVAKPDQEEKATVSVGGNAVSNDKESVKETTEAAQKEADKLLEEVKKEDPKVISVDLEVSANVKDEAAVADDAKKIEEELDTKTEEVVKYLDVSVALRTTTIKDDVTKVEKKDLDETDTMIPITFSVPELGSKIVRIAHVHDGQVEFLDYVADYENNLVTVYMNKFSTLAVITSDTARVVFVTADEEQGSVYDVAEVKFGEKVSKPEDPEKEGYTFAGWYTEEELTNAYDFDQEVTEDMYLYAKWTKNEEPKKEDPKKDNDKKPSKDTGKNTDKKTQPAKKTQTVAAKTAAKTGDTSNVWMLSVVMLLAAGTVVGVMVYRKKQR
ncbi:hypothetical protein KGMB01110_12330 [Mediterraneibacter butyricigenes]|uniref:Gram-positive cocci surface proteins LPxTG domain-containing protein n=1 Tax=Mediterraneibacter butyricigenes TaxID=2316025 RepID=A0A391P0N9_9FIRM|nr:InlB B-repeat-containing protein [Mediterraneibacter butyricigenes]GCA66797.1 hypothetical protein KGMB01110_12330 [Mediterraneibacter butyricigenes]